MEKVHSWQELTLREKICQTVIPNYKPWELIEEYGSVEAFIRRYPVGGFYNDPAQIGGMNGSRVFLDKRADILACNEYLRVPLFLAGDHGNYAQKFGCVMPSQMNVGAANDRELAYRVGEFKAEDSMGAGVNWVFWPVCDLSLSPESLCSTRVIGTDPDLTVEMVKEELRAMKERGIIATLKHFPGPALVGGGIDSHLAPSDNLTPVEDWWRTNGRVYQRLFAECDVPAVMTAHRNLAKYQTDGKDGKYPPATMSYDLATRLLRQELGFRGVVITDALNMGGFSGRNAAEKCVESFLNGNDVLLWPQMEYVDLLEQKILSGEVSEARLNEAVERIWNLKKEYGILDGKLFDSTEGKEFFSDTLTAVAEKSLTLVQNYGGILPFSREKLKKVLIVGVTPDDGEYASYGALKEAFEKYGCEVELTRNLIPWEPDTPRRVAAADLVLFAECRNFHRPIGPLEFWDQEACSVWASNTTDPRKTVIVNFGSPYIYKFYRDSGVTYINAYSTDRAIMDAVAKAILGEIPFSGTSPVRLR